MKIEVSEETLLKTTFCKNNNLCLHGELHLCCKVVNCVDGKIHFVKPATNCYCNSLINFGSSCFCCCPTRKEIFNKYER